MKNTTDGWTCKTERDFYNIQLNEFKSFHNDNKLLVLTI